MFKLQYYNKKKLVGQFEYLTLDEAQDAIEDNDIWNESTSYKIVNRDGDIEEEDEFETNESILGMMFPDEESYEGFDVNEFSDKD